MSGDVRISVNWQAVAETAEQVLKPLAYLYCAIFVFKIALVAYLFGPAEFLSNPRIFWGLAGLTAMGFAIVASAGVIFIAAAAVIHWLWLQAIVRCHRSDRIDHMPAHR